MARQFISRIISTVQSLFLTTHPRSARSSGSYVRARGLLLKYASLLWEGTGTQTVFDVIVANYSSLPNNCMRQVLVKSGSGTIHGTVVFKASNTHGKVIMLSFLDTNLVVYQLRNGTWTESIK
jgi:hypothetical protein